MKTDYTYLLIAQEGGICTVTMNRPDVLNAVTPDMLDELHDALLGASVDEAVRCIVLRGAGRAFGSGQDLKTFAGLYGRQEAIDVAPSMALYHRVIHAMRAAPKPIIAAVHGVAAGASCNLALACDLRIASEDARFIQAFARIGLVPDGGAFFLPQLIGLGKALELALLADEVTGREAERLGLVNRCVPAAEFEGAVQALAHRLAHGPTTSYGLIKQLLYQSVEGNLDASLQHEIALQNIAINSADHREGVMAFLEKRPPNYTGR